MNYLRPGVTLCTLPAVRLEDAPAEGRLTLVGADGRLTLVGAEGRLTLVGADERVAGVAVRLAEPGKLVTVVFVERFTGVAELRVAVFVFERLIVVTADVRLLLTLTFG